MGLEDYYMVKDEGLLERLPTKLSGRFADDFQSLTEPFIGSDKLYSKKSGEYQEGVVNKGFLIVDGIDGKLYDGDLWNCDSVETISNMDYMYCLSAWDWWINPEFESSQYRGNNYSVIFVDDYKSNENLVKNTLRDEGYRIIDERKLYENNSLEIQTFYDYHRILQPMKIALRAREIERELENDSPDRINFLLRGGYFLKDIIDYEKGSSRIINPENNNDLEGEYILDESIVKARNIEKLGLEEDSEFKILTIDSAVPKEVYENKFPKSEFRVPTNLLSIFGSRIVEKNPKLIGADYSKNDFVVKYNNKVRSNLIREIRELKEHPNLDKKFEKLAHGLINRSVTPSRKGLEE